MPQTAGSTADPALVLRHAQLDVLADARRKEFHDPLVEHLHAVLPDRTRACGREGVALAIELGVSRCRAHGITRRRHVAAYCTIMFYLGSDFELDPGLAEVSAALGPRYARTHEDARMALLVDAVLRFCDAADGRDNSHLLRALRRVQATPLVELLPPESGTRPLDYVSTQLRRLLPERTAAMGATQLAAATRHACARSSALGVIDPRASALFAGAMLLVGAAFERDPLAPWVRRWLDGIGRVPAAAHAERLHARLVDHIDRLTTPRYG